MPAHESVLLEMGVHGGRSGRQPRSVPIFRRRQPQVRPAEDADIVSHVHGSGRLDAERQVPIQGSEAAHSRHLRHATGNRAAEAHGHGAGADPYSTLYRFPPDRLRQRLHHSAVASLRRE